MNYSDNWDEGEATVLIERNPRLVPVRRTEEFTYSPPPAGRYDNDRPTITELQAIGD